MHTHALSPTRYRPPTNGGCRSTGECCSKPRLPRRNLQHRARVAPSRTLGCGSRRPRRPAAAATVVSALQLRPWVNGWSKTDLVELVHLYSNLHSMAMFQRQVKAGATLRPRDRPAPRQIQTRLDPYQPKALAMAYRDGKTIKELACAFGVHRVTVASLLRRHGVELRQVGLSTEQVAEASRLYPEGWSLARLADRYDVDDMTVRRYLLLAGGRDAVAA